MSKASEWANARPPGCDYHGETIAQVTAGGSVRIVGWPVTGIKTDVEIPEGMALAIAHWILDTFEDPPYTLNTCS